MSKSPGRPRKIDAERYPSGQTKHVPVHLVRETVAIQRCKAMGWKPTLENQKKAASATYGTTHGRLYGTIGPDKKRLLSADQYAAAELYQKRDHAYRSIKGLPRATISAQNIEGDGGGTTPEGDPEEIRKQCDAASSALEDVRRALLDVNAVMSTTTLVILQQEVDEFALPSVQRGLQSVFNACVQGQRKAG